MNMFDNDFSRKRCTGEMEIYTRVVGFYRPTKLFNKGKKREYANRIEFKLDKWGGVKKEENIEKEAVLA